ncbi:hypothetical protein BRO54_0277 [Geobacillus proteiniphilus]|uniref:Uncharacterized protein n=1 Tax=Geobacillus proteiniphilus TaxID=860353 RepID=A0A1Q5T918_9BACL|nr:hypothetical protein BRO54_0277 [Geobacillus proteiniphilus]
MTRWGQKSRLDEPEIRNTAMDIFLRLGKSAYTASLRILFAINVLQNVKTSS